MITIIGNSLNSCNKKVLDKMNKMDFEFIKREIDSQLELGAEYIQLNAVSLLHNEIPFLREVIPVVEENGGKVLVRSNNVDTLKEVPKIAKKKVMIGDIEFDKKKLAALIDIIQEDKVKVIALINDHGSRSNIYPERSLLIAQRFVDYLLDHGIKRSDILLDPSVRSLEEDFSNGKTFLNTLELFKLDFPQVKTIANLYALSEGLPKRYLINSYFLSLAIEKGLDYIVLNVLGKAIIECIISTLSIIGKDKNMQSYLKFCREFKEQKKKEREEENHQC
ncbi:MAG: dihydropteroate synthase [Candidatus Aminicenantes bacterium]|nr:dihydropteroate synthase [Candidatus Aminicenantes bacterium]